MPKTMGADEIRRLVAGGKVFSLDGKPVRSERPAERSDVSGDLRRVAELVAQSSQSAAEQIRALAALVGESMKEEAAEEKKPCRYVFTVTKRDSSGRILEMVAKPEGDS